MSDLLKKLAAHCSCDIFLLCMALILGVEYELSQEQSDCQAPSPSCLSKISSPSPAPPQCSRLSVHFITLSKLRCQQWDVAINSTVASIQISLVFPWMCFLLPEFSPASPCPLVCDSFLSLSLLFVTLRVLRSSSQIFCKISFSLSDLFLMIRLAFWAWGRSYRGRCFASHVGVGGVHVLSSRPTTGCVNLDCMAKVAFQVSLLQSHPPSFMPYFLESSY